MTVQYDFESNRKFPISYEDIMNRAIEEALDFEGCPYETEVNIVITDNEGIQEINEQHRNIQSATDVLSFPMLHFAEPSDFSHVEEELDDNFNPDTGELLLGDIVISAEKIKEQAEEYGHSQERELAFLTVHSMLHLFGYDHMEDAEREVMEEKQRAILSRLGIER